MKKPGLPQDTEIVLRCQCGEAVEVALDRMVGDGVDALRRHGWFWGVASPRGSGRALLDPMCGPCARREMPEVVAAAEAGWMKDGGQR